MSKERAKPWWNHHAVYAAMVLVLLAMNAGGLRHPRARQPSPLTEEQAIMQALDARLTTATISAALLQHPALALGFVLALLGAAAVWLCGAVLLFRWFMARQSAAPRPGGSGPPKVWSLGDVVRVVIVGLFAAYLVPVMQGLLRGWAGRAVGDLHLWMLISMAAVDGAALLLIVGLASSKARRWRAAIGWRTRGWLRDGRRGILAYLTLVPALTVAMLVVINLAAWLRYTPPPEPLLGLFLNESRRPVLLVATLFVCLLGPLVEEVVFRGVLYAALRRRWGVRWSLIVSGGCFAALHTNPVGLLPIWLLGGALAYLYETTGSLVPSITLHAIHNTTLIAVLWFTKALLAAIG